MSRIYWHTQEAEQMVAGSERAYMSVLCNNLAEQVVRDEFPRERHRLATVVDRQSDLFQYLHYEYWTDRGMSRADAAQRIQQTARNALSDYRPQTFTFDGGSHEAANLVGNTVVAMGSPQLALLAKLHGYCESHAWVAEGNRHWLAAVIGVGRVANILRANQGWEDLMEFLRQTDLFPGPVVTSYSVCEQFPSMTSCDWMDPAWPPDMVANKSYDYSALDEQQQKVVDARSEAWDEDLADEERWDLAFRAIQKKWWLELTPETLTTPTFAGPTSLWDMVASEEWRNG